MNRSSKKLVGDGKPHERRHPLEGGGVRITTFVPFHFKKRGIKKVIVAPDGVSQPVAVTETPVLTPEQDQPLLKALGRGIYWQQLIDSGAVASGTEIAEREGNLCDFLNASPSDLWSDAQLQPLETNHSSIDLDADSVQALVCGSASADPLRLASQAQAGRIIQNALDSLTPREADVIRERFFVGSSLDEIAEKMEVTRERVRQIEGKALRKLRHESRIPHELAGIADVIGGATDA